MVKPNDTEISFSRVLSTSSGKSTGNASLRSIPNLILRGSSERTDTTHPIVWIAESDQRWRISGLAGILEPLGIKQSELITDPGKAITQIAKIFGSKKGVQDVARGVKRQWQQVCDGEMGLPIDHQVITPHQVLRVVVNNRKDKTVYRKVHVLPALYTGICTCCNLHGMHNLLQLLTTVPMVNERENVLMKTIEDMSDVRGDNFSIMSSTIMDVIREDRNAGILLLLQSQIGGGGGSQAVIVPLLTERWKDGSMNWAIEYACANCLHNMNDPYAVAASAYATAMTTNLFYDLSKQIGVAGAKKLSKRGKNTLDEIKDNRDRADRHLKEVKGSGKQLSGKSAGNRSNHNSDGKMSKVNADAFCRELILSGLKQYVYVPKDKSRMLVLNRAGVEIGMPALRDLLSVKEASANFVNLDDVNVFEGDDDE